jgi:hypothetical protein
MEATTLWYGGHEYNEVRVIERLADLVAEKGGRVEIHAENLLIKPRGFREVIRKEQKRLAGLIKRGLDVEKSMLKINELEERERNAPAIESRFCSKYGLSSGWIHFTLNGYYYSFSFADNPFFEDVYMKIRLENGSYIGEYYANTIEDKTYYLDELWSACASESTINDVAKRILDVMETGDSSKRIIEKERKRVPNTYNNGYHYETIVITDNARHTINF